MVNKNVLMNQKFNELSTENKMKVLNITDEILSNHKYKHYAIDMVVNDMWSGKTNSQKRKLMRDFEK